MITLQTVKDAHKTIKPLIKKTPLIQSQYLSNFCKGNVFLKLENQQLTNSFKIRGAFNRMAQLSSEEIKRGVVTASSGNHGHAVALAAEHLGLKAKIVVPKKVSKAKLEKIMKYNVEVIQEGDYDEVEPRAREIAHNAKMTYVSPYNDEEIIAGQGTVGLEIIEDLDQVDIVLVPIGGGGLISGVAFAVKQIYPHIQVIGVQPEVAATMYASIEAGEIVEIEEMNSFADGLMGGLEKDSITFGLIQKYVDQIIIVKEETIKKAIYLLNEKENQIVEGAGATSIAPILENKDLFNGKTVVSVISGGNIQRALFEDIIKEIQDI